MTGYCEKARIRFKHWISNKPQHQPYPHVIPTYGAKQQFATAEDDSPALIPENKAYIQEVIGTFLYYTRAVDCTMLAALGSIAAQQATPTEKNNAKSKTTPRLCNNSSQRNHHVPSK